MILPFYDQFMQRSPYIRSADKHTDVLDAHNVDADADTMTLRAKRTREGELAGKDSESGSLYSHYSLFRDIPPIMMIRIR